MPSEFHEEDLDQWYAYGAVTVEVMDTGKVES